MKSYEKTLPKEWKDLQYKEQCTLQAIMKKLMKLTTFQSGVKQDSMESDFP